MGYRFIDVSGVGNSGKSALVDLLREFEGLWVPEFWFEFDILRIPGGLLELKTWLCDDWSPVRSHSAVRSFHDVAERMGLDPRWWDLRGLMRSTSQRYDRRFKGRFRDVSHRFADSFVIGRYRSEWPYDSAREGDLRRFVRKILRRVGLRRQVMPEVLLVDGVDFSARATHYLDDLYSGIVGPGTEAVVLNNGLEPFNPLPGLDMIRGSRQCVVTRDPRDVFVSGLGVHQVGGADRKLLAHDNDGVNKSFLATDDIQLFVKRYRLYHEKLYRGDDPRVLRVRFEDLVRKYETTVDQVAAFLGLDRARQRRHTFFSPDRSGRNVGVWRQYRGRDQINYIERELSAYLVED
ncbi:MAG TPA: sulfotransferase [Steroidobacteraceae bacterium]